MSKFNIPDGATHYSGGGDFLDFYRVIDGNVEEIQTGSKWRTPVFDWNDELRNGEIKSIDLLN